MYKRCGIRQLTLSSRKTPTRLLRYSCNTISLQRFRQMLQQTFPSRGAGGPGLFNRDITLVSKRCFPGNGRPSWRSSCQLPVASKATAKRTKTAFENAGFITHSVFDNFVAVDLKG